MEIYTVVYVFSGVLSDVIPCAIKSKAEEEFNRLLVEHGICIEDYNDMALEEYTDTAITEIDGKHYFVNDDDCLEIHHSATIQ